MGRGIHRGFITHEELNKSLGKRNLSNENLEKAVMNLANIYMVDARNVSTYELIDCDVLFVDKSSFQVLTEILSS